MLRPAVASLIFGALWGLIDPRLLYSVEIAQAVSGIVSLPPQAPMALHHHAVFSLIVDSAAMLLRAGVSEDMLCRVLTIMMSAVASLSVCVTAYAFTSNSLIAMAAPVAMLTGLVTPVAIPAHKYPLTFPSGYNDLGVNGLFVTLIVLSSLAIRPAIGALLLPLIAGVHISFGVMVGVVIVTGCRVDRALASGLAKHWRRIALSAGLLTAWWGMHQLLAAPAPPAPPVRAEYVRAVIQWWDVHRAPMMPPDPSVREVAGLFNHDLLFLAVATLALASRVPALARVRFWIVGQVVVTIGAMIVVTADEFFPAWGPLPFHGLMISRWMNVNQIVKPLLLTALLLHLLRDRDWSRLVKRFAAPVIVFFYEAAVDSQAPLVLVFPLSLSKPRCEWAPVAKAGRPSIRVCR